MQHVTGGESIVGNKRNIQRQRKRLRVELNGSSSFTVDVSPGGFCLETMRPALPGSSVIGKLRMADRDLEFTGVVCWAKASEPRLQMRGRVGVRFTSIHPDFFHLFAA